MYLSLKWKAASLILIILLAISGYLIVVNNGHLKQLADQQQQQALEKLHKQLSGSLLQSYRHNLQLIDLLPSMSQASTGTDKGTSSLADTLQENWISLQLNWGTERITLYNTEGNILWQSESPIPSQSLKLGNAPKWAINCEITCRQIIASPIIDRDGETYYIQLEVSTADLLLDFNKTSGTEIGMLAPLSASDTIQLYNLSSWNRAIKLMTNPKFSLDIISQLEAQASFEQSLKNSQRVRSNNKTYDITITQAGPGSDIHFIILMDVTDGYSIIENAQKALVTSAVTSIFIICSIILAVMWRPMSRLKNQSRIMPLMITGNFTEALQELDKNRSNHWLKDEIDVLNDTEEEVCKQLSEMRVDIHKKAKKLHNMAMYDSLTKLPNRRSFMQFMQNAFEGGLFTSEPFSLLFIDLDNFKRINDSLGHNAGDELLTIVAQRLKSCIRRTDIIARLGGDEFCIILEDMAHRDDYSIVAENVLQTLRQPIVLQRNEVIISASIGIVSAPKDGSNSQELLQNADIAMYEAKALGRNKYLHFDRSMTENVTTRFSTESELRSALKRNEFVLYYQPQINLQTGKLFGFEALIRWQHPDKGLLFPDNFIDILEETGLIVEVGEWVANEACRQVREWLNKGLPPTRVAINLSPRQLQQENLAEQLHQSLELHRLDTDFIELEVTESMIMEDMEFAKQQLSRLRAMGFSIAIDDFGTGHSSLSYLNSLPLDILKIDRSFVHDLNINDDDQEIVSAIIAMAHKLKLKVIAEGVETEQHRDFLLKNYCDYSQGYLYSPPVPAAAAESMIDEQYAKPAV